MRDENSLPQALRPAARKIQSLLEQREAVTVALDGRAGAGKSTAAALLAEYFGARVVHMDDFFLPAELRTPERMAEPGGNVHYERFCAEVLPWLTTGRAGSYRVFDCARMALAGGRTLPAAALTVVEGSYSTHPAIGAAYDLRIFAEVEPEEQMRRIEGRSGPGKARQFRDKWIPLENAYFEAYGVKERCDMVLRME